MYFILFILVKPLSDGDRKLFQFLNDAFFERAILENVQLTASKQPVYFYLLTYEGELGAENRTWSNIRNTYLYIFHEG